MTDAEYYELAEKEEKEKKKLYQKIINTANEIENYRLMLYTNESHKKFNAFEDEFQHIDDELFRLQSELRKLHDYCMA